MPRPLPFLPLATEARRFPPEPLYPRSEPQTNCEEVDDQYSIDDAGSACSRVFCYNPPKTAASLKVRLRPEHLLGPAGHVERANAWTHVAGAVLFGVFATLRPLVGLDTASFMGTLSLAVAICSCITFGVSTFYHTFSPVGSLAPYLRVLDHGIIYISLALAAVADIAVVTNNFERTTWQAYFDPLLTALLLLAFFTYRRAVLHPDRTRSSWGSCALGLFRSQHVDREHAAFRSAGYLALALEFILFLPVAVANLPDGAAAILIACNGTGLLLLVLGVVLDNALVAPDAFYSEKGELRVLGINFICNSRSDARCGCGCVMTSHAWWHVLCLASVLVQTIGREVVIERVRTG